MKTELATIIGSSVGNTVFTIVGWCLVPVWLWLLFDCYKRNRWGWFFAVLLIPCVFLIYLLYRPILNKDDARRSPEREAAMRARMNENQEE